MAFGLVAAPVLTPEEEAALAAQQAQAPVAVQTTAPVAAPVGGLLGANPAAAPLPAEAVPPPPPADTTYQYGDPGNYAAPTQQTTPLDAATPPPPSSYLGGVQTAPAAGPVPTWADPVATPAAIPAPAGIGGSRAPMRVGADAVTANRTQSDPGALTPTLDFLNPVREGAEGVGAGAADALRGVVRSALGARLTDERIPGPFAVRRSIPAAPQREIQENSSARMQRISDTAPPAVPPVITGLLSGKGTGGLTGDENNFERLTTDAIDPKAPSPNRIQKTPAEEPPPDMFAMLADWLGPRAHRAGEALITPPDNSHLNTNPPPKVPPTEERFLLGEMAEGARGLIDEASRRLLTQPDTDVARMQRISDTAPPAPSGTPGAPPRYNVPLPPAPTGSNATFRSNLSTSSGRPEVAGSPSVWDNLTNWAGQQKDALGANTQDEVLQIPGIGPVSTEDVWNSIEGGVASLGIGGGGNNGLGVVAPAAATVPSPAPLAKKVIGDLEFYTDAEGRTAFVREISTGRVEKTLPGETKEEFQARTGIGPANTDPAVPSTPTGGGTPPANTPVSPVNGAAVAPIPASGGGGGVGGGGGSGTGGGGRVSQSANNSGGGRSGGGFGDFSDNFGSDREFTEDDFLSQAGGNRKRARQMAEMANKRRRSRRGRSGSSVGFGGAPSNAGIRDSVLAALAEMGVQSRAQMPGKQKKR